MRPIPWIIVFALLPAACSGSDPVEQVESARSWTATSIFLGERWLNHSVPDGYSIDALANSGEELSRIADGLEQSMADSSPPKVSSIIRPIRSGAARTRQMAVEVRQKNAPAFAIQLDSLRAAGRLLESAAPKQAP